MNTYSLMPRTDARFTEVAEFRTALRSMFAALRSAGFFARLSFQCCQSCAWAAVPDTHKGAVAFTHKQDSDGLNDDVARWLKRGGKSPGVHVAFGVHGQTEGEDMLLTQQAGQVVANAARLAGLVVEWDGSPGQRVWVALKHEATDAELLDAFLEKVSS